MTKTKTGSLRTGPRALLDRARRFWGPAPAPDHPLSEAERTPEPERTDRAAREWQGVFGDTLRSGDE